MAKKFDYAGAKKEGYSDEEIHEYLMSKKPKFDVQGAIEEGHSLSDINKYISSTINKKSPIQKVARGAAQLGIGALEGTFAPYELAVSPLVSKTAQTAEYRKNLFEDIERLSEQKMTGQWSPQDEQLLQSLIQQVKEPKKAEKYVKTADIGVGGLLEKAAKPLDIDLEPEDIGESATRFAGAITSPQKILRGAQKGAALLTKEGRAAAKIKSQWESLEKAAKGVDIKESAVNFARKNNLTPDEATLLMQSKGKIETVGKIARKTKRYDKAVKGLREKLGENYEEMKRFGRKKYLTKKQEGSLNSKLGNIVEDLKRTKIVGPDNQQARNVINNAIIDIEARGATIEELINSRQNVRQSISWNKIDAGDVFKERTNDAFLKAIEQKNPKIAQRLKETDVAYRKMLQHKKLFRQPEGSMERTVAKYAPSLLFSIGSLFTVGVAKGLAGKEIIQRLATRLLVDPKYQDIRKKMMSAVLKNSPERQAFYVKAYKEMLKKDDPALYEEFEDLESE